MNTLSLNILALALLTVMSSCSQDALNSSVSSTRHSGLAVSQVESGTMISKDSSRDTMITEGDAEIVIGAGSLQVDTAVSMDGFKPSNGAYIADELGMASDDVTSVAVTQVTATSSEALTQPMTVKLKIEENAGLFAAFLSDPNYFVVYSYKKPDGSMISGIISGAMLAVADGWVTFKVDDFGVFELFKTKRPAPAAKVLVAGMMNPFGKDIAVSGLSTKLMVAGQTVTIKGEHFDKSTRVYIAGKRAKVTAVAPKSLSATVPAGQSFGEGQFKVMNRYKTFKQAIFYKGDKIDFPLVDGEPASVCKGQKYYNIRGEKRIGRKICAATDFPVCAGSMRQNCKVTASHKVYDTDKPLNAFHILDGHSIGNEAGRLNPDLLYSHCEDDGQDNCRASADFPAVKASALVPGIIKAGVTIAGVTGSLSYQTKEACSSSKTGNCKVGADFTAIDSDQLTAASIRAGKIIGGVAGIYPSDTAPLPGDGHANLTQANFTEKLANTNGFQYYDRQGNRYTGHGDSALKADNISEGVSILGVGGTYKKALPVAGNEWDYKFGYSFTGITGKVKTSCRNLVLPDQAPQVKNNSAGHFTTEPTLNPWGTSQHSCLSEGWENLDTDCNPANQDCLFKDLMTGRTWLISRSFTEVLGAVAQTRCENSTAGSFNDWRTPTQKEAMQAVINGISSSFPATYRQSLTRNGFWTSTVSAWKTGESTLPYWSFGITSGMGRFAADPSRATASVACIR